MNDSSSVKSISELELAISGAENLSDAEIVAVISGESGSYNDIPWKLSAILAFAGLLFTIFASISFTSLTAFLIIFISFITGFVLPRYMPTLKVILSSENRQLQQVQNAAELIFVKQAISLTNRRTGILIYLSLLEDKAALICDTGIRSRVPEEELGILKVELSKIAEQKNSQDLLVGFIRQLGETMEKFVPPHDSNPDELDNTPVYVNQVNPSLSM